MSQSKVYGIALDSEYLYVPIRAKIDPYTGALAHSGCMPGWFGGSAAESQGDDSLRGLEVAIYEESQHHISVTELIQKFDMVFFLNEAGIDYYFYTAEVSFNPGSVQDRTAYSHPIVRGMYSEIMQYELFPGGTLYKSPQNNIFSSLLQVDLASLDLLTDNPMADYLCSLGACMAIMKESRSSLEEFENAPESKAFKDFLRRIIDRPLMIGPE